MSSIPIVQGTAVSDAKYQPYQQQQQHPSNDYVQVQLPSDELRRNPIKHYQDVVWAILFVVHLILMLGYIGMGWSSNNNDGADDASSSLSHAVLLVSVTTGLGSAFLSTAMLGVLMQHTEALIKGGLILVVVLQLVMGVFLLLTGQLFMGIISLAFFALLCWYAKNVWTRIPFAVVNLQTALTAVRLNMGLMVLAVGFMVLAVVWTIAFTMGVGDAVNTSNMFLAFFLLLSYYWVHQVLQNTMQVITCGVVGTWWWYPLEAAACWSQALTDSLIRALTYSFGSICFGSFLVALIQALRALEQMAANQREGDGDAKLLFLVVHCLVQFILGCIESILEFINRWAYTYVGIYGFGYLEAGRNVFTLFQNKGWTAIISDNLCRDALLLMSLLVGLCSGLMGLVIGYTNASLFQNMGAESSLWPSFGIGFLCGFLVASVMFSVVGAGVNTVIVCFAEDPAAFERNHPELSGQMRAAWVQAWPELSV